MTEVAQFGGFELGECIGKGGMGKVYRAVHRATEVPAAVKIIEAKRQSRIDFHREVQAQAGLAHPGVVRLFDYGMVDGEAAQVSQGKFEEGCPYVVMELADRGSVSDHGPFEGWQEVRKVVLEVLDALAYAHARGVIHKDLKPANFLVVSSEEGPPRIKLADFGLAHALERESELEAETLSRISGTPLFMAPEQFHGQWRSYGPWTDLYALGCIVWHLVCGEPPVTGKTAFVIAMRHCEGMYGSWKPQFEVPPGVEEWVRRAMAVDPGERFQRAVDAAWTLPKGKTEDADDSWWGMALEEGSDGFDSQWRGTTVLIVKMAKTTVEKTAECLQEEQEPLGPGQKLHPQESALSCEELPPPIPASWTTPGQINFGIPPAGTGQGLFGLREVPFVGRRQERHRIWEALRQATQREELRIILITGESGVGKSRLVRWMATRAHEVGAVEILFAKYSRGRRGPAVGMTGLVQRAFRTWKLSRQEVYEHLGEALPVLEEDEEFRDIDARALTELIHPTDDDAEEVEGPRYQFRSARQEHALMSRLMRRFSRRRTPLLWLDDVQYDLRALGFLEYLIGEGQSGLPGLVLATLRSDALANSDKLAGRVREMEQADCCERIDVEAIGAADHRELIKRMLPLAPELADFLARRTEGNPLFAHQLLNDWIASDKLESRRRGFDVAEGQSLSIPDDIHELWMTRLQRVLDAYPTPRRDAVELALELAAIWGREVSNQEWRAICARVGCEGAQPLLNELVERGLADRGDGGWSFAHGLLVESLERKVREEGRWLIHHRRCAQILEPSQEEDEHISGSRWRRYAEHRREAEEYELALEPLLAASDAFFERGDPGQRRECLELHRELLNRLELGTMAKPRLENELRTSHVKFLGGGTEEAIAEVEDVLERCRRLDDDELVWRARERLVRYLPRVGKLEEAAEQLELALELAMEAGDDYWQGKLFRCQGDNYHQVGEVEKAQRSYLKARVHFREAKSAFDELLCESNLGWVSMSRGEYEAARARFDEAKRRAEERGFALVSMHCVNGLADVARFRGELDEACEYYDQARRRAVEAGQEVGEVVCGMNLCLVEMARGNFDRGAQLLDTSVARTEKMAIDRFTELFDCMRMLLACGRRQWSVVAELLEDYGGGWPEGRPVSKDHAWMLELASEHARRAGQAEVERRLLELALEIWRRLGDVEAVAKLEERLGGGR